MAQITTASSAARPVSLVDRAAAMMAAACAADDCACGDGWSCMLSDGEPRESGGAGVARGIRELLLDPQELVVLGDPLAPRRRAGLDLAGVGGDGEVGDER